MQPLGENTVNTPAFLGKLWKMVNDPATDHLICWGAAGTSFVIQNQAQFWYELLPLYYKHNNMSSFVRQLNMYGFHKMSTVENGTMDSDKDEIQFTHPFFQKDQPELLRNIKRKATTAKSSHENNPKHDDLTKVLTDVKQLRGRQATVDGQLSAMKQENALLWREVAILRQKHLKQQKIVNKLIQFLVTLVQPSRMTVGVKRGPYQLMLNESPPKKTKVSTNGNKANIEGPTIHELDNELELNTDLYEEELPLIDSPATSTASQQTDLNSPMQSGLLADNGDNTQPDAWDKADLVTIERHSPSDFIDSELNDESLINTLDPTNVATDKVFLNPSTQDTLLSNLMKGNYNTDTGGNDNKKYIVKVEDLSQLAYKSSPNDSPVPTQMLTVATRDNNDLVKCMPGTSESYSDDLSNHIESTQTELEQFKDILNGYNAFVDANTLLGEINKIANIRDVNLFHDGSPPPAAYDLNVSEKPTTLMDSGDPLGGDPLVSGSEIAPYGTNFDFTELFDDSADGDTANSVSATQAIDAVSATINTPQVARNDPPVFPTVGKSGKK